MIVHFEVLYILTCPDSCLDWSIDCKYCDADLLRVDLVQEADVRVALFKPNLPVKRHAYEMMIMDTTQDAALHEMAWVAGIV